MNISGYVFDNTRISGENRDAVKELRQREESSMSEQTKHERFISEETLEQIGNLIEPLSNYFGTPMTLLDAECNIMRINKIRKKRWRRSDRPPPP